MKGIIFNEQNFHSVIEGKQTKMRKLIKPQPKFNINVLGTDGVDFNEYAIRNFKQRYKLGETLYIKEPYSFGLEDETVYKYSSLPIKGYKWIPALLLPEKYARYFIEITSAHCERVQDISDEDCLKEGIIRLPEGKYPVIGYPFAVPFPYTFDGSENKYALPSEAYAALFNKINGKGAWKKNPYVWVYSFKLVNKSFDSILEDNKEILRRLKYN